MDATYTGNVRLVAPEIANDVIAEFGRTCRSIGSRLKESGEDIMAEVIDKIQGRSVRRYPWAEWMDGKARRAVKGVDFDILESGFRTMLYTHASIRGMKVETFLGEGFVEFQFKARVKP